MRGSSCVPRSNSTDFDERCEFVMRCERTRQRVTSVYAHWKVGAMRIVLDILYLCLCVCVGVGCFELRAGACVPVHSALKTISKHINFEGKPSIIGPALFAP